MKSTKLLFRICSLSSSTSRNFFQQRYLLHTCSPYFNKENSSSKKSDGSEEQPHMRVEAKAAAEEKRMYD